MIKRFLQYYTPHKKILTLDMLASLLVALIVFGCVPFLVLVSLLTRKRMRKAFQDSKRWMSFALGVPRWWWRTDCLLSAMPTRLRWWQTATSLSREITTRCSN